MQTTSEPVSPLRTAGGAGGVRLAVMIGALGVVFGDIGTSPIYTLATLFDPNDPHPVPLNIRQRLRRCVTDLLVGDDHRHADLRHPGDARRQRRRGRHHGAHHAAAAFWRDGGRRTLAALAALGIFGASLFFGDSMITPAMSMMSAIEGLKVVEPSLGEWVVPITAVITHSAVRGAAPRHERRRSTVRSGDDRSGSPRSAPAASRASSATRKSSRPFRRLMR